MENLLKGLFLTVILLADDQTRLYPPPSLMFIEGPRSMVRADRHRTVADWEPEDNRVNHLRNYCGVCNPHMCHKQTSSFCLGGGQPI